MSRIKFEPGVGTLDFAEECRRQSRIVGEADLVDPDLQDALDAVLADIGEWTT